MTLEEGKNLDGLRLEPIHDLQAPGDGAEHASADFLIE